MKFTLDTTLPETFDVTSPDAAVGVPFAEAVFAAGGVASIFGVNDFVTVRRQPGCDWGPIVAVVVAAAAAPPVTRLRGRTSSSPVHRRR